MRKRKRVKTDAVDAYELANLLRLGSLPEGYIAPPELRELRELVRHRRQLTKTSTSVKAQIRALLAKQASDCRCRALSPRPGRTSSTRSCCRRARWAAWTRDAG